MRMIDLFYDNYGIARSIIEGDTNEEYCTSIDKELKRSWCSCPYFIFNKSPCKHILYLLENIEKDKMVNKKDKLNFVSTGSTILDDLLGGGVPYGIVTSIFGEPMSGKSMFAFQMLLANVKYSDSKSLYIDTEGMRPQDFYSILDKFKDRWGLTDKDIKDKCEFISTLGDLTFTSVQKLFRMFGYVLTYDISKGGKYTPKFEFCKPTLKEEKWDEYSMVAIDSITKPLKDSIGANTQNLPARAQLVERLFGKLYDIATRHNLAIIINSHASIDPITPFGRDFGHMWGGDGLLYNSKYALEFIDANTKIKNATGWGIEARRVKLIRRPDEQSTGDVIPIRLKKDYGYCDE